MVALYFNGKSNYPLVFEGLTESVSLQRTNNNGIKGVPIVESRFYGTATNVQDYANQLANKNQYKYIVKNTDGTTSEVSSVTKSAVHYTDFVGRSPLFFLRSKYTIGGNEPTGGIEDGWFVYSHSSYVAQRPDEYLKDENNNYINTKGNIVNEEHKVKNEYLKDFTDKWNPKNKLDNPSLPRIILPNQE